MFCSGRSGYLGLVCKLVSFGDFCFVILVITYCVVLLMLVFVFAYVRFVWLKQIVIWGGLIVFCVLGLSSICFDAYFAYPVVDD